jgi:hypothetical protein
VTSVHPLSGVLDACARGCFPSADGAVDVLPPDSDGARAVVAMTGHAFVLADVDPADLAGPMGGPEGGFGAALMPAVLTWLAGDDMTIGSTDVVLVAVGTGGAASAVATTAYDDHPRVVRARAHRRDVAVYSDTDGVVIIGRGLVGRTELSVELFGQGGPGDGAGRRLIAAGLATVLAGEWCWGVVLGPGRRRQRPLAARLPGVRVPPDLRRGADHVSPNPKPHFHSGIGPEMHRIRCGNGIGGVASVGGRWR